MTSTGSVFEEMLQASRKLSEHEKMMNSTSYNDRGSLVVVDAEAAQRAAIVLHPRGPGASGSEDPPPPPAFSPPPSMASNSPIPPPPAFSPPTHRSPASRSPASGVSPTQRRHQRKPSTRGLAEDWAMQQPLSPSVARGSDALVRSEPLAATASTTLDQDARASIEMTSSEGPRLYSSGSIAAGRDSRTDSLQLSGELALDSRRARSHSGHDRMDLSLSVRKVLAISLCARYCLKYCPRNAPFLLPTSGPIDLLCLLCSARTLRCGRRHAHLQWALRVCVLGQAAVTRAVVQAAAIAAPCR